jgi:hypothetical protein
MLERLAQQVKKWRLFTLPVLCFLCECIEAVKQTFVD